MNILLNIFWSNEPIGVDKNSGAEPILVQLPLGVMIREPSTPNDKLVYSVNSKTGEVILTPIDIGAASETDLANVKHLAEINQLNIGGKADQQQVDLLVEKTDATEIEVGKKASLVELQQLTTEVSTKATKQFVLEEIAKIIDSAPESLDTLAELAAAITEDKTILDALNIAVANRVRFDVNNQGLTDIQKANVLINIGAESVGVAQTLVNQVTPASIGAATKAQGTKADTALQSTDVAPVALSGSFSSLADQAKLFNVLFSAYQLGTNQALAATDTLGTMLGKLQAQVNANKAEWVAIEDVGIFDKNYHSYLTTNGVISKIELARINGNLWIRGVFRVTLSNAPQLLTITDIRYKCKCFSAINPIALVTMAKDNSGVTSKFVSNISVVDEQSAANSIQTITTVAQGIGYNIYPQAIGELIIK